MRSGRLYQLRRATGTKTGGGKRRVLENAPRSAVQRYVDASPRSRAAAGFQSIADASPHVARATELQALADSGISAGENRAVLRLTGGAVDLHERGARIERTQPDDPRLTAVGARSFASGEVALIGSDADRHHELWHLVQQAQGRVPAGGHLGGTTINSDPALEREADDMGAKLARMAPGPAGIGAPAAHLSIGPGPLQRTKEDALERLELLAQDYEKVRAKYYELSRLTSRPKLSLLTGRLVELGVPRAEADVVADSYHLTNYSSMDRYWTTRTIPEDVEALRGMASTMNITERHQKRLEHLAGDRGRVLMGPTKSAKRAGEKAEEDKTAAKLQDIIRGTVVFDRLSDLEDAWAGMRGAIKTNAAYYNIKDRFRRPMGSGYRDIKLNRRDVGGYATEIQLNVSQVLVVKEKEHLLYDVSRILRAKKPRKNQAAVTAAADRLDRPTPALYREAMELAGEGRAWPAERITAMDETIRQALTEFLANDEVKTETAARAEAEKNLQKLGGHA